MALPSPRSLPSADPPVQPSRATAHLKQVPADRVLRDQIRQACQRQVTTWDRLRPLTARETETRARQLLAELDLPEGLLGWTMVALASAFWREQVAAVPCARRLLLLPHCLRDADECPARHDELGLHCQDCGRCQLSEMRALAQRQGYHVMIAEGSPIVMQVVLSGHVDAILGVACLDALEKTFDKILLAGIPCLALPLLEHGCRNTSVEDDFLREMILTPYRPSQVAGHTYVHLVRAATRMFDPAELARLAPRSHGAEAPDRPVDGASLAAATERAAYDFLVAGGKFTRPFLTLAAYDAMTGGHAAGSGGAEAAARVPEAVRAVALAIEVFHKASLVHDDIEDDDPFRYGQPTLHRQQGVPAAVNIGDYLVGLGYRLVARQHAALGAEAVAEILAHLADAHTRLCEGQGAELAWRGVARPALPPLDVLKIYALKTAPAFEAALLSGLRLAGKIDEVRAAAVRFCRHLGVGYQIVNDLEDWQAAGRNKLRTGTDVLGHRPTILLSLARETLGPDDCLRLAAVFQSDQPADQRVAEVAGWYHQTGAFQKASQLVLRHRQRAHAAVESIAPVALRRLLDFLADAILVPRVP